MAEAPHDPNEWNSVEKNLMMQFWIEKTSSLFQKEDQLKKIVESTIKETGATILKEITYKFEPIGESGVYILAESDATYHTYPQYWFWSFSVSTCGKTHPFRATKHIISKVDPVAGIIKYFKTNMDLKNTQHVFPDTLESLTKRYKGQLEELLKTYTVLGRELEEEDFKFFYAKSSADPEVMTQLTDKKPLHLYVNMKNFIDSVINKNPYAYFK